MALRFKLNKNAEGAPVVTSNEPGNLLKAPTVRTATTELNEGDVISYYGVLLRLKEKRVYPADKDPELRGDTVTFRTEIEDDSRNNGFIPEHWLKDWVVQGNKLATWAKVVC